MVRIPEYGSRHDSDRLVSSWGAQAGLLAQAQPLGMCRGGPRRALPYPTVQLGPGKGQIRFARAGCGCWQITEEFRSEKTFKIIETND